MSQMKPYSVAVLAMILAASMSMLVGVDGQNAAERSTVIEDPEGDVQHTPNVDYALILEDRESSIDIIRFEIGPDSPTIIPISIQFPPHPEQQPGSILGREIAVFFQFRDAHYVIKLDLFSCRGYGLFTVTSDEDTGQLNACVSHVFDDATSSLQLEMSKEHIIGETGIPMAKGDHLEEIYVETWSRLVADDRADAAPPEAQLYISDRAPDEGETDFTTASGAFHSGDALFRVGTLNPLRATNGANATFSYLIEISSLSEDDLSLAVTVENLWDGAKVFAKPSLTIPALAKENVPVYLEIPFGHQHGKTDWFTLRFHQIDSDAFGELDLGIHWLSTPQPAGHHPRLWFHSSVPSTEDQVDGIAEGSTAGTWETKWINAVEMDLNPAMNDAPVSADNAASYGAGSIYRWVFPLHPSLQLGLNFDVEQLFHLETSIENLLPLSTVTVQTGLGICKHDPTGDTVRTAEQIRYDCIGQVTEITRDSFNAGSVESDGVLSLAQDWTFQDDLLDVDRPTDSNRIRIPYHRDHQLVFAIEVIETPSLARDTPEIGPQLVVSSSILDLPLEEFTEASPLSGEEISLNELPWQTPLDEGPSNDLVQTKSTHGLSTAAVLVAVGIGFVARRN